MVINLCFPTNPEQRKPTNQPPLGGTKIADFVIVCTETSVYFYITWRVGENTKYKQCLIRYISKNKYSARENS